MSKTEIKQLLNTDFVERKQKRFRLISGDQLVEYLGSKYNLLKTPFVVVESDQNLRFYNTSIYKDGILYIQEKQSLLNNILQKHHGYLAMCGGQVLNILNRNANNDDIDLFFYNTTPKHAEKIIVETIHDLSKMNFSHEEHIYSKKYVKNEIYITRNKHVVNITVQTLYQNKYVNNDKDDEYYRVDILKLQFVLRIYPRLDLIIGGFDLTIAALAYDGYEFHATQIAAWSVKHRTNIIDISRCSTSFEYRLTKYHNRKCIDLLLPGVMKDDLKKEGGSTITYDELRYKLETFVEKYGYYMEYDDNYDNHTTFERLFHKIPDKSYKIMFTKANFEQQLIKFVTKYPNYTPEKHPLAVDDIFDIPMYLIKTPIDELFNLVTDFIKQFNYFIPADIDHYDTYKFDEVFYSKSGIFQLFGKTCYNGGDMFSMADRTQPYDIKKYSDYAHNHIHINKIQFVNSVCLVLNNVNAIKTYFTIDLDTSLEEITGMWNSHISNPFIGDIVTCWELCVEQLNNKRDTKYQNTIEYQNRRHFKIMGEYGNDFMSKNISDNEQIKMLDIIETRITKNHKLAIEELTGLSWITKNPTRQWTSSFNPVIKNPREWYKPKYTPFIVGIPENIETLLRLVRNRKNNVWSCVCKDIFNMLLLHIARVYWD